MNIQGQIFI